MELLRNYVITLASFAVVDAIWLGFVARRFYQDQIGFLLKSNTNWGAAALFYLLYIVGLATLEGWPVLVTVVDILWGTALGGAVSFLSYTTIRLVSR